MTTPLMPARLRCAHRVNPLSVSPDRVRLSWEVRGEGSGRLQRAYQIRLMRGDAPARDGAPVWDSGRVESSSPAGIGYAGSPLARGRRYTWQVRMWDENLVRSDWSELAWFEVELDPAAGWRGSWIGLGEIRESVCPPTGAPDPV
jgi:alpha-L-rhamnosidase